MIDNLLYKSWSLWIFVSLKGALRHRGIWTPDHNLVSWWDETVPLSHGDRNIFGKKNIAISIYCHGAFWSQRPFNRPSDISFFRGSSIRCGWWMSMKSAWASTSGMERVRGLLVRSRKMWLLNTKLLFDFVWRWEVGIQYFMQETSALFNIKYFLLIFYT